MKSQFSQMMENPKFQKFFSEIQRTANYFVATHEGSWDTRQAMALCLAYAFEAGLQAKEG